MVRPGTEEPIGERIKLMRTKKKPKATGYSVRFNFAEAFKDAIANLPDSPRPKPDPGRQVVVTSIGTVIGGTRPEKGLYVTVTASY